MGVSSQFTSEGFTGLLEQHRTRISMDGKGRYTDNIFVERLWRTVKYEEVYLKAYTDGRRAKTELEAYFHFSTGSLRGQISLTLISVKYRVAYNLGKITVSRTSEVTLPIKAILSSFSLASFSLASFSLASFSLKFGLWTNHARR